MRQEKQRLKKLCSFFAEASPRFGLVLVYLFGSQVGGHLGPLSDYDFGILFSRKPANRRNISWPIYWARYSAPDKWILWLLIRHL